MLATILKSPVATQTTIAIVETFTKLRELSQTVSELTSIANPEDKSKQKSLMKRSGEILADLIDDGLQTTDTETTFVSIFCIMLLESWSRLIYFYKTGQLYHYYFETLEAADNADKIIDIQSLEDFFVHKMIQGITKSLIISIVAVLMVVFIKELLKDTIALINLLSSKIEKSINRQF